MEKQPAVYILASERNGTLYTGVTSNLVGRTWQHRNRTWKLRLIQEANPHWVDLWESIIGQSHGMDSRLRGNDGQSS